MRHALLLMAAGLGLSGCATKPMTVDCAPFRTTYSHAVPRSPTMVEIQSGAVIPDQAALEVSRSQLQASLESTLGTVFLNDAGRGPVLLALSGGGQWGAFGAAYLRDLDARSPNGLPKFDVITGVSTGALQALYVGAANGRPDSAGRAAVLTELTAQYNPQSEDEIVHRSSKLLAPIKGAVAKLGPLRRRIEAALCKKKASDPVAPDDCPLIKQLADPAAPTVLLGFVEAETGEMQFVNVTDIARAAVPLDKSPAPITMRTAQQCITGGALASVAMPFFYQQVQVTSNGGTSESPEPPEAVTYYDGGVRQSMFLLETTRALTAMRRPRQTAATGDGPEATIYLVRNGPTIALPDRKANGKRDAISSAERGYSLIVNQSEVTAIEAIRLREKVAEIRLATADGYDMKFPETGGKFCEKKDKEAMFEPQFMACLQEYGRYKAGTSGGGWTILSKPK